MERPDLLTCQSVEGCSPLVRAKGRPTAGLGLPREASAGRDFMLVVARRSSPLFNLTQDKLNNVKHSHCTCSAVRGLAGDSNSQLSNSDLRESVSQPT